MKKELVLLTILRILPSAGPLCLTLITPLIVELSSAATFFIGIAWIYFLGIISRGGIDFLFLKFSKIKSDRFTSEISKLDILLIAATFLAAFPVAFACLLLNYNYFYENYLWVMLSLPAFSSLGAVAFFLRSNGEEYWGTVIEPGTCMLLIACILSFYYFFDSGPLDMESIFTITIWAFLIVNIVIATFRFEVAVNDNWQVKTRVFESAKFLVNQISSYLTQWYPIFLLGSLGDRFVLYFSIANSMATVIYFTGVAIDAYAAPRFAKLWQLKDYDGLGKLKSIMWKISGAVSTIILIVISALSFFYGRMQNYDLIFYVMLTMLLISSFVSVALGPNGFLLMMSGESTYVAKIAFFTLLTVLFLTSVAWHYGNALAMVGMTAMSIAMRSVLFFIKSRRMMNYLLQK